MSYVNALYHIVFSTKYRDNTVNEIHCEDLYRFIWKLVTDHNCKLIRINGTANHLHMLVNLHSCVSLATLVREIKSHSSGWMQRDDRFRHFRGWAKEYYASTVSPENAVAVVEYIKNQKEHHGIVSYDDEVEFLFHPPTTPR